MVERDDEAESMSAASEVGVKVGETNELRGKLVFAVELVAAAITVFWVAIDRKAPRGEKLSTGVELGMVLLPSLRIMSSGDVLCPLG